MREERVVCDGLPARVYDPGQARGVLLFGHGGGHSKDSERFVRLSRAYAEQTGLAVVCIDAVDHGERRPAVSGGAVPSHWHVTATPQMVADWQRVSEVFSTIGPPVAYVGFSMGMIFGAPTVAAMPSMKAAVFGVGGLPSGGGIDDPLLREQLLEAAAQLTHPQVLMLNVADDDIFPVEGVHRFFDAIPGQRKRLVFWPGTHDEWPAEAIRLSVDFINEHTSHRADDRVAPPRRPEP